jgi:very-short-patch-repair endonuclease
MDDAPFLGSDAVRQALLTDYQLRTWYRAVHRNVYVPTGFTMTAEARARAAWLWAGGDAVLARSSAAAVLGTRWLDGDRPAELIRSSRRRPAGLIMHTWDVTPQETCVVRGMKCTTPARTAFDIGRTLGMPQAVPILDALMNATRLSAADVITLAEARPRHRGVRRLRAAMAMADAGAESPQESRVRLLLCEAGLPKPETQIEFRDRYGAPYIRVDMGWREWRLAVEYDGVQHWTDRRQRSWDIDRIAILDAMGWTVVRVSAEMLQRPDVVVARVTAKLRAAGCPI